MGKGKKRAPHPVRNAGCGIEADTIAGVRGLGEVGNYSGLLTWRGSSGRQRAGAIPQANTSNKSSEA